jgi:hypothetical protein
MVHLKGKAYQNGLIFVLDFQIILGSSQQSRGEMSPKEAI